MSTNPSGRQSLPTRLRAEFDGLFRSLSNPNLRLYFIGQLISVCGTWMQSVALSWLVYKITDSALALGVVAFAGLLPVLLLSYFAGGIADRYDRKRTIMITQSLALTEAVVLGVLTWQGLLSVPVLVGLALFVGICTAFEVPSRQAFLSDIAKGDELVNTVGLNSAMVNVCRMLGPVLAGVIVGTLGEAACFWLNALSYVAALAALRMIKVERKEKKKGDTAGKAGESVWEAMKRTGVVNILVITATVSIFGFQYQMLLPVIVKKLLMGESGVFATMSAIGGAGALLGSLALASRAKTAMLKRLLGGAILVLAAAIGVLAWSHSLPISCAAVAVAGACISVFFVGGNSYVQTVVPEAVRGRVLGIYMVALLGVAPIGSLMGGWFAERFGVQAALFVIASVCGLAAVWYLTRMRRDDESAKPR